jgi:restriction system protein
VITDEALRRGYLAPAGLTPSATMYAALMLDVRRRARRGDEPRFTQLPEGLFGLAAWAEDDLLAPIERHNREVKAALLATVSALEPFAFEGLIAELLTRIGFEDVTRTRASDDAGIDVTATLVSAGVIRTRMAVQVKRWQHNVQAPTVQQLRGALGVHDQGLIITTSDFSAGARAEASKPDRTPVALINGVELTGLLVEQQLGIRRSSLDLLEVAELFVGAS